MMDWTKVVAYIGAAAWIPHICRWAKKIKKNIRAENIEAWATVVLAVIALVTLIYGIYQYEAYKTEKRAYVSLIDVNIGSNFSKDYPIIHPNLQKDVFSAEIIASDREVQEKVEEIIINLRYKNTGPIAAEHVKIFTFLLAEDSFTKDGKPNQGSVINDKTTFRAKDISQYSFKKDDIKLLALLPEQETSTLFMFHRKQMADERNILRHDSTTTNSLYLICDIKYQTIGSNKEQGYFGVYKLYHYPAFTRIYKTILLESKMY